MSLSKPATRSPPDARTGGRHLTRLRDSASTGKATSWSGCRRSFSAFVGRAGRRRQRCGGGQAETARPPRARWRPSSAALTGSASATTRSGGTKPSTSACPQVYTKRPRGPTAALLPITYPGHYEVRRVSRNGGIRWGSLWVNVSHVLAELDGRLPGNRRRTLGGLLPAGLARSPTRDDGEDRRPSRSRRPPRRREPQRESVTCQLITNCYPSPELFSTHQGVVTRSAPLGQEPRKNVSTAMKKDSCASR